MRSQGIFEHGYVSVPLGQRSSLSFLVVCSIGELSRMVILHVKTLSLGLLHSRCVDTIECWLTCSFCDLSCKRKVFWPKRVEIPGNNAQDWSSTRQFPTAGAFGYPCSANSGVRTGFLHSSPRGPHLSRTLVNPVTKGRRHATPPNFINTTERWLKRCHKTLASERWTT